MEGRNCLSHPSSTELLTPNCQQRCTRSADKACRLFIKKKRFGKIEHSPFSIIFKIVARW